MNLDVPSVSEDSSFIVDDKTVESNNDNEMIDENAVNIMLNLGKRNRKPPSRYVDIVMDYEGLSEDDNMDEDDINDNDSEFVMDCDDEEDDDISLEECDDITNNELDLIKSDFKTVLNVSNFILI